MEPKTIVCLASYFKGYDFMDEMKQRGYRVILITSENIRDRSWPWHAVDEVFYMQETTHSAWNLEHLVAGLAHLMRHQKIHAVIGLDDYDVEKAALLRETFRIPGMGQSTYRYFRDKLAMRRRAADDGITVPAFSAVFNDQEITDYAENNAAPWVLKPRSEASASGIKNIQSVEQLWEAVNGLGDQRHLFLVESFKPGDVYHVDSLSFKGEVVFTSASSYLSPPMQVSHNGGVFRTMTLDPKSSEFQDLEALNKKVLKTFGLKNGASHTEFIRCHEDGKWYFLETSARVGGAHIPDLIEAATNVNIWREWAKIEDALLDNKNYQPPVPQDDAAGLLIALITSEYADRDAFPSENIYKYLEIPHHAGLVYKASDTMLVRKALDQAAEVVTSSMLNILPPQDKPTA